MSKNRCLDSRPGLSPDPSARTDNSISLFMPIGSVQMHTYALVTFSPWSPIVLIMAGVKDTLTLHITKSVICPQMTL